MCGVHSNNGQKSLKLPITKNIYDKLDSVDQRDGGQCTLTLLLVTYADNF